mmetsp:Transcript_31378/g.70892  ORF Transcript_31378/g.70892 Transcript_31378/m.70892 type:complete len:235 (-) Transcript_31378:327-1031(-)
MPPWATVSVCRVVDVESSTALTAARLEVVLDTHTRDSSERDGDRRGGMSQCDPTPTISQKTTRRAQTALIRHMPMTIRTSYCPHSHTEPMLPPVLGIQKGMGGGSLWHSYRISHLIRYRISYRTSYRTSYRKGYRKGYELPQSDRVKDGVGEEKTAWTRGTGRLDAPLAPAHPASSRPLAPRSCARVRHARDASRSRGSSRVTWQLTDHVAARGSRGGSRIDALQSLLHCCGLA